MDFSEFQALVERTKSANPSWFTSATIDVCTYAEIAEAEKRLAVKFPVEYSQFLSTYGGGNFAFANVFSARPDSRWDVVRRNREIGRGDFLAVSDDQAGGYYGFSVSEGAAHREVIYLDAETGEVFNEPKFPSLFDYLALIGMKP